MHRVAAVIAATGATDTYTVIVTNNGTSNVTGATVSDVIGSKLTNVSWSSNTGDSGTGNVSDTITLNTGGTVTYTVTGTVSPMAAGERLIRRPPRVTVLRRGSTDPNTSNNVVTDTDSITNNSADVQVTDAFSQSSYASGTNVTYTIVASNAGPNAATGAVITDTVPGTLTGVSWSGTDGHSGRNGALTDTITLASGDSRDLHGDGHSCPPRPPATC